MILRRERTSDRLAIEGVHEAAFATPENPRPVEVGLLQELRRTGEALPHLSFVVLEAERVVGHVLCSRARIGSVPVVALGPVGVLPSHQNRGRGGALVHAALAAADACDEPAVGLLGSPGFYARFGFVPASRLSVRAPDESWGDYFQLRPLSAWPDGTQGPFCYAAPFSELS